MPKILPEKGELFICSCSHWVLLRRSQAAQCIMADICNQGSLFSSLRLESQQNKKQGPKAASAGQRYALDARLLLTWPPIRTKLQHESPDTQVCSPASFLDSPLPPFALSLPHFFLEVSDFLLEVTECPSELCPLFSLATPFSGSASGDMRLLPSLYIYRKNSLQKKTP